MKKKTYQQPEMKVVKLEQTEIICASLEGAFKNDGAGFMDLEDGGTIEWDD